MPFKVIGYSWGSQITFLARPHLKCFNAIFTDGVELIFALLNSLCRSHFEKLCDRVCCISIVIVIVPWQSERQELALGNHFIGE